MGAILSRSLTKEAMEEAKHFVDGLVSSHKIVVLSKTYCPYCVRAKDILKGYPLKSDEIEIVELERRPDCSAIQAYCKEITGASSVPRIFIGGKSIGGCDDLTKLKNSGQLDTLLSSIGIA